MKRLFWVAAMIAAATPILAADINASLTIGQPGFYGRLDIGGYPQPAVIYRQPVVIERVPIHRPPVYMHVPPGHAKHWAKHCHQYNACGERVLFVQDSWYDRQYVPRYQERQRDRHGHGHDEHKAEHRGDGDRNGSHGHSKDKGHDH